MTFFLFLFFFLLLQKRNKPVAPPKAPEKAPFFLPTLPGLQPKFALPEKEDDGKSKSRLLRLKEFETQSEFGRLLSESHKNGNCMSIFQPTFFFATPTSPSFLSFFFLSFKKPDENLMARLMEMGPSAIDLEIRSLSLLNDLFELKSFISFIKAELISNKNFELVQTFMSVFLQVGSLFTL